MSHSLLVVELRGDIDVVRARQRARQIAELLGLDAHDQTRVSAAVSELARNAFQHAHGGTVRYLVEAEPAPRLVVKIVDKGPGIADVRAVLEGRADALGRSGLGLVGARRLVDDVTIESVRGEGTTVTCYKALPRGFELTKAALDRVTTELVRGTDESPLEELRRQNQELLRAIEALRTRDDQMQLLNRELDETNRGVMTLYAELEDKADSIRRSAEVKVRFFSHMNHEVRTPINAILGLSEILLDGTIASPLPEQEKPLALIRKSAQQLSQLVDDLLDYAKLEAGKMIVRAEPFSLSDVFAGLRGMFRPLHTREEVALVVDDVDHVPILRTDEGKVSQILRNFVSNALKFTDKGEVRVTASYDAEHDEVIACVIDTGLGIAPQHRQLLFSDFTQIDNDRQKRVKGTGLGLSLSRSLAELLGGTVSCESELGKGSTFSVRIPRLYVAKAGSGEEHPPSAVVVYCDHPQQATDVYRVTADDRDLDVAVVRDPVVASRLVERLRPSVLVWDAARLDSAAWDYLASLSELRPRPHVMVVSAPENEDRARGLGARDFAPQPVSREWLFARLRALTTAPVPVKALVIDDDEIARYLLRAVIGTHHVMVEATTGEDGLREARTQRPGVVFLDLDLPGMSGFDVLDALKQDPLTRDIPVVVQTSLRLTTADRERLRSATAVLDKEGSNQPDTVSMIRTILRDVARSTAEMENRA